MIPKVQIVGRELRFVLVEFGGRALEIGVDCRLGDTYKKTLHRKWMQCFLINYYVVVPL